MNTLFQERHKHCGISITVKMSRGTQRTETYRVIDRYGLAFFCTDLEHVFVSKVGIEFVVMLRRKGPHKPEIFYDLILIHSCVLYTDLIEYTLVADATAPLQRCFIFAPKLKAGDIISAGQYMNYQTFRKLQFRRLLKNSFHSFENDFRYTSDEKTIRICWYHSFCFDVQKSLNLHF